MKGRQFEIYLNTTTVGPDNASIVVDGQKLTSIRALTIKAAAGELTTIELEETPATIRVHGRAEVNRPSNRGAGPLPLPSLGYGEPEMWRWRDGQRQKAGWCLGIGAYAAWVEDRP